MSQKGIPKKRLIAAAVFVIVTPLLWLGLDLPPPLLLARYGLPPHGGPTGSAVLIAGIPFAELSPGYYRRIAPDGSGEWVEIRKPFWIAETELTNEAWSLFRPEDVEGKHLRQPVTDVSYEDVVAFCIWASMQVDFTLRPPTEREWEYACRAGTTAPWSSGEDPDELGNSAWFVKTATHGPWVVRMRQSNPWGISDMHGNVAEWCSDAESGATGASRAVRGGHWESTGDECASGVRELLAESAKSPRIGFRPVAVKDQSAVNDQSAE